MNDLQLKYLLSIVETGSFTRTAECFFVSQPTISSQIKQLEHEIGFALFERKKNGVILTAAGKEYVGFIREMEPKYKRLCSKLSFQESVKKQTLSIGILDSCYSPAVYDALNYMHSADPDLNLKIAVGRLDTLENDFRDRKFDVIITGQDLVDTVKYSIKPLESIDIVIVYRKDGKYGQKAGLSLADFCGDNLIVAALESEVYQTFLSVVGSIFTSKGLTVPRMLNVSNDKSIIATVRAGLGVGIDTLDQPEFQRGDLGYVKTGLKYTIVAAWHNQPTDHPLHIFLNILNTYTSQHCSLHEKT